MGYFTDLSIPRDILDDAFDVYGHPADARTDLSCDEGQHTKVRAYKECRDGSYNATFVCKDCGENLVASNGNWVSQDEWTEDDWNAAQDWDEIRESFDARVEAEEKMRKLQIRQYCKQRLNQRREQFSVPDKNATGKDWHAAFQDADDGELWDRVYEAYLDSRWWRSRRKRVMKHYDSTCQIQYPGCVGTAHEVHHRSYEMIGFEPLYHLVPVCKHCHQELHEAG